jgi:AraC family cel operon transcriptional repressor
MPRLRAQSADPTRPDVHLRWSRLARGAELSASRTWYRPGDQYPVHTHDYSEVFWLERGTLLHRTRGGVRSVARGEVVLLHPDCAHGIEADAGSDAVIINVAVPLREVERQVRLHGGIAGVEWGGPRRPRYAPLPAPALARLDDWFAHLRQPANGLERDAFLLLLLSLLARVAVPVAERAPTWLEVAVEALAKPHHLARGVSALVELSGYSREHVSRGVRRYLGISPRDLVRDLRLAALARRLREDPQPWGRIAGELGIVNLRHIGAAFRRRYGCSPAAWRQKR